MDSPRVASEQAAQVGCRKGEGAAKGLATRTGCRGGAACAAQRGPPPPQVHGDSPERRSRRRSRDRSPGRRRHEGTRRSSWSRSSGRNRHSVRTPGRERSCDRRSEKPPQQSNQTDKKTNDGPWRSFAGSGYSTNDLGETPVEGRS